MQIKTTMRHHLTSVKQLLSKRQHITSVGVGEDMEIGYGDEDMEKREFSYTINGNVNWSAAMESST